MEHKILQQSHHIIVYVYNKQTTISLIRKLKANNMQIGLSVGHILFIIFAMQILVGGYTKYFHM